MQHTDFPMHQRIILTTATLAALMAPGREATAMERLTLQRRHAAITDAPLDVRNSTQVLELGGFNVGLDIVGSAIPRARLEIDLLLDPSTAPLPGILLWAGRKNGWGSEISEAHPSAHVPGLYAARVSIPDPVPYQTRLWLAVYDDTGHTIKGSVPLMA